MGFPPDEALVDVVRRHPGSTKWELVLILGREGWPGVSTSQLNSHIYRIPELEWRPGIGYERRWYFIGEELGPIEEEFVSDVQLAERVAIPPQSPLEGLELYPWQLDALKAWEEAGRIGVVEAVTGSGKTRLAIAAIASHLNAGGRAVIVVPTKDLVYQWRGELERLLLDTLKMTVSIGQLGDGFQHSLVDSHVLVATAQSAFRYVLLPDGVKGLLVADEVHHYGAERWSAILEDEFEARLGLTATYERDHDGYDKYLDPFFEDVVFSVDYERALDDGVIAPFRIAFIGVPFTPDERSAYDAYDEKVRKKFGLLVNDYGLPATPHAEFMRGVNRLSKGSDHAAFQAGLYLSAFNRRREVLAGARSKFARLDDLVEAVRHAEKTIVFAQTVQAASRAVEVFQAEGIEGALLTSDMPTLDRRSILAGFEDGTHELVAAPRLLDEGIDVAAADLAIILAASRSRRQMVQRMGRVLRLKDDGRDARLAVLFVEGTAEDPRVSQEAFLEFVENAADEIEYFDSQASAEELAEYLAP